MLTRNFPPRIIIIAAIALFCGVSIYAQNGMNPRPASDRDQPARPNILRALGLSEDQVKQMQAVNREVRPRRQAAQQALRMANRDLDMAIYADNVDEAEFARRLTAYQDAQAAVAKINFENELAIRKILTPEQLVRFRELRQRFNKARERMQERRNDRIRDRLRQNMPGKMPPRDGNGPPVTDKPIDN